MPIVVTISERDVALLRLLEMTPATATQIRKASVTFPGEPFRDERRVRERLQTLAQAGFTKTCTTSLVGGGRAHYYRLTPIGYRAFHAADEQSVPKSLHADIPPSRFQHTITTADVIVHMLACCHARQITVLQFHGDGRLTLEVGEYRQQPDCHFQVQRGGRVFNLLFEVDNATEPLDSRREQSIRTKILGYESYTDWVLTLWKNAGRNGPRPSFRVVFLTKSIVRANHILYLGNTLARNKDRRIIIASTQDVFLAEQDAVTVPIFNDHWGHWQALANPQLSATYKLTPISLYPPVVPLRVI